MILLLTYFTSGSFGHETTRYVGSMFFLDITRGAGRPPGRSDVPNGALRGARRKYTPRFSLNRTSDGGRHVQTRDATSSPPHSHDADARAHRLHSAVFTTKTSDNSRIEIAARSTMLALASAGLAFAMTVRPKAVIFDLDGCLWYPDMT